VNRLERVLRQKYKETGWLWTNIDQGKQSGLEDETIEKRACTMRRSIRAKEKVVEQMQKSFDEIIEPRNDLLKSKKIGRETIVVGFVLIKRLEATTLGLCYYLTNVPAFLSWNSKRPRIENVG
jgi:hypothetical protein